MPLNGNGWIGVDLDRTLAYYDKWVDVGHIGEPIEKMANRLRRWLAEGEEVRIFTARVSLDGTPKRAMEVIYSRKIIDEWMLKHFGRTLAITCIKDFDMRELWDDRAVQVIPNTGERVDGQQERS